MPCPPAATPSRNGASRKSRSRNSPPPRALGIATIRAHHRWFAHYHTAGVPGRHEIDATQELDYPAIMRAIAATGFTGFVGQEFLPVGDPLTSLREAIALCTV